MTDCHIINPPLTQITHQCLPRHRLLPNTNPNPNLSFSLFRTNPLHAAAAAAAAAATPDSSRHRTSVGHPPPCQPPPARTTSPAPTSDNPSRHRLLRRAVILHHASSSPFRHTAGTSIDEPLELAGQSRISGSTCTNTSASSHVICHTRCQNHNSIFTHRTTVLDAATTWNDHTCTTSSPWKPPRVRTCISTNTNLSSLSQCHYAYEETKPFTHLHVSSNRHRSTSVQTRTPPHCHREPRQKRILCHRKPPTAACCHEETLILEKKESVATCPLLNG